MFSPTLGRFITTDPSGFNAEDVNLYRFVSNDPTNHTDPAGLQDKGTLPPEGAGGTRMPRTPIIPRPGGVMDLPGNPINRPPLPGPGPTSPPILRPVPATPQTPVGPRMPPAPIPVPAPAPAPSTVPWYARPQVRALGAPTFFGLGVWLMLEYGQCPDPRGDTMDQRPRPRSMTPSECEEQYNREIEECKERYSDPAQRSACYERALQRRIRCAAGEEIRPPLIPRRRGS